MVHKRWTNFQTERHARPIDFGEKIVRQQHVRIDCEHPRQRVTVAVGVGRGDVEPWLGIRKCIRAKQPIQPRFVANGECIAVGVGS